MYYIYPHIFIGYDPGSDVFFSMNKLLVVGPQWSLSVLQPNFMYMLF